MRTGEFSVNSANDAFDLMEAQLNQQVEQDLATMEAQVFVPTELDPLQALAAGIEAKQGRGYVESSETRRSERFKRERFKSEVESQVAGVRGKKKHEARMKALDERKNNIRERQFTRHNPDLASL